MKRFITEIIKTLFLVLIVVCSALILGPIRISHTHTTWQLPQEKHILFCGASHIYHGINDSLTISAINLAKASERYMYTYLKLEKLLQINPQIDTIYLQFAPTDMWKNTDDKYFRRGEQIAFAALYWPLFGATEWNWLKSDIVNIGKVIIPRIREPYNWSQKQYIDKQGGFSPVFNCFDTIIDFPKNVTSEGNHGYDINYYYCRKIIELCNQQNVKLCFLFMPVWKHNIAYDLEYYYNAYNSHFSDVELLDYHDFDMDLCERMDSHHLNYYGATRFTQMLQSRYSIR